MPTVKTPVKDTAAELQMQQLARELETTQGLERLGREAFEHVLAKKKAESHPNGPKWPTNRPTR